MIKLCIGSVFKTISLCKNGRKPNDESLADALFDCTGATDYNHQYIGHIKDCSKNLPEDISWYFSDTNVSTKLDAIKESCRGVFTMLPDGCNEKITKTLVDIIKNDNTLPDVPLGIDRRYKTSSIRSSNKFEPVDFLANILISVCKGKNDLNRDSGIDELNEEYINNCFDSSDITIVDSVDQLDPITQASSNATQDQQMNQYNYGGVVINNPTNMNFINHVENIHFD